MPRINELPGESSPTGDDFLPLYDNASGITRNVTVSKLRQDKGEQVYNVKAYGAAGDGTTDDTTAIGSAITAAVGGGVVFFPAGTYKLTSALALTAGINLQGASPLSSIINQTSTSADAVTLNNIPANYNHISNLKFSGPGSGTGIGIDLIRTTAGNNQSGVHIQDVIVSSFGSHGILCTGAIVSTFERVSSQSNGGDGFHVEQIGSNAGSTSLVFTACYANANTGNGFYIGQNATGSYTSLVSCAADSNNIGYNIFNIENVGLYSCGAEVNTAASYKIDTSSHIVVSNCLSTGSKGIDFWMTNSSTKVTLTSTYAVSAGVGHTAGVQVDAGSHALLINHENSSSVTSAGGNIFTGTVVELDETVGTTAGYVAIIDGTQTLTNKTLTAPVIATIVNSGTSTIPTTTGTLVQRGDAVTLSNKSLDNTSVITIKAGSLTIQDATDITKQAKFDATAIPTATSITLTLPTATDRLVGRLSTDTLTNKRVTKRVNTVASSATPTINTDSTDLFTITAQAAAITSMTTNLSGTPTGGQSLLIRIKDNGSPQTISWGTSFASSGVATLLATTVASKTHWIGLTWDDVASKWVALAVDASGY